MSQRTYDIALTPSSGTDVIILYLHWSMGVFIMYAGNGVNICTDINI